MAEQDDGLGPALSGRLIPLLKRALLELELLHEEHLSPSGITGRQLGLLLLLAGREPESQQQAAARLGLDRTTMVGLLDGLEAAGLVIRRPDVQDRRRNVVELTPAGRAALVQATRASDDAERRFLRDLDPADAAALRDLLGRVARPGLRAQPR